MVRRIIIFLLLAGTAAASNMNSLYDEFLKPGAESKGYANALTASELGLISIFYNPANLALNEHKLDLYFCRENYYLINDISHLSVAAGARLWDDPVIYSALSWRKLDYFDLVAYDDNENIMMFSTGIRKSSFLFGFNFKYLISVIDSEAVRADYTGWGLDTGFSFLWKSWLASISSFNTTGRVRYPDGFKQDLTRSYQAGISFKGLKDIILYTGWNSILDQDIISLAGSYQLTENFCFSLSGSSRQEAGAGIYFSIRGFFLKYGYLYSLKDLLSHNSFTLSYGF
ncbi:MAG: hypothetical protein PHF84_06720 [bacterium]|nr:hypothetical protein [bacterium]